MKITCPSCSARYSIDDAKVKGKAFKFTCKKCGQTHVYRGTGDGAAAVTSGPAAGAPAGGGGPAGGGFEEEAVWYVAVGEEQQGPYTAQQIREYAQTDQLDPESFIWKEGMEDWLPYQQIPEFADLAVGGGGEAPAPAAPSPADSPFGGIPDDVTVASPFAAAAPPPADSGDLFAFGGSPRAAKPAESSPFDAFGAGGGGAAAVAARGGADVFGAAEQSPFDQTEDREQDVMMGAAAAAAASPRVDASKMIGQRNENSVLFSLSSLQALAGGRGGGAAAPAASVAASSAAGPKPGFAGGEGSGLIDIRAMAGASARREEKPDDLFALGGGGAIGAPVAVPILTRPIRHDDESKRPMYILVGVIGAFAIAIIVLLVFLLKGGDKEKVVVKEVPAVAGDTDGGTVVAATAGGPEADAGASTEEPDAGAAKTDEDKGAAGDAGTDVPGDGDPNAKAADGADGGDTGEPPGSTGTGRRRDGGRNPGGDDPPGPTTGPETPPARDAGSSGQTRDAGRLAGDLSAIGLTPRRDAGSSSSSQQSSTSGLSATPDRDTVRSKFESVRGAVRACTGGQAGTAQAQTTIQGSTGRVTRVNVTGDFTGPAATCITNAIRGLQFPQFSNPTLTVNYSYRF